MFRRRVRGVGPSPTLLGPTGVGSDTDVGEGIQ